MFSKKIFFACALALLPATLALAETTVIRETTVITPPPPLQESVTTTTVTTQTATEARVPLGAPLVVRIDDFDVNHDNLLAMDEIGYTLFKLYDTDGNQVIDNIEYERPALLTVTPMQTTTKVSYDFDGDGMADKNVYTYDTFMQHSHLTRFDSNGNGLSPREFAGMSFLEADIDNDRAIREKEWQGLYVASIDKKNRAEAALNK